MKKKHILVVSQCFYPEQFRINDICTEWVRRGYKVTVITGIPNYPEGRFYKGYGLFKKRKETYNGMEIIRLPIIPRFNNPITLSLNYLSFVIAGFFWKIFTKIEADFVFNFETSPMSQALPAVWYAKKKNIPCYIYVQDLWPENVEIVAGIKNKIIISSIDKMVDYIYRRCDKVFATSKSFVRNIEERGVPEAKLKYWPQYAEDFYKPIDNMDSNELLSQEFFNITFTGNIGEGQGLDILIEAMNIVKKEELNTKIRINIIGSGRYKNELIKNVSDKNLKDMFNFISRQPATKIPEYLAVSDVAFLSLKDDFLFSMTIPAKLQSYMACGVPILAAAIGETERIILESKSGMCSPPGAPEKLAKNIIKFSRMSDDNLEELGKNAREYYNKNFNKKELLDEMDKCFE